MSSLDPARHLRPVLAVPAKWSADRVLAKLRSSDSAFAVIEDNGRPLSLLTARDLELLGDGPLAGRLEQLPALLLVDAETPPLDIDDLVYLARLLTDGRATGFGVLDGGGRITGAVHADDVDAALPADAIGGATDRFAGNPGLAARWYVCRTCVPSPSRRAPSTGSDVPTCPRNWLHGPMEPET
jgi:CBS domain